MTFAGEGCGADLMTPGAWDPTITQRRLYFGLQPCWPVDYLGFPPGEFGDVCQWLLSRRSAGENTIEKRAAVTGSGSGLPAIDRRARGAFVRMTPVRRIRLGH
ncbi:hypothetical protein RhoFasB10_01317 [Rhodococcus sp. B10]|nr:hypothetical protein [Rhodococcus sp. B10]